MKVIKRTADYTIYQKRSERYAVKSRSKKQWVRGDEKVAILSAENLVKAPAPKPAEAGGDEGGAAE